ncbi:MAG: class I SAM-dependent methyltransferase [Planctomycetales bacterium]|nr:class I SAM-dependent methyltransferase [Planctomycetales bacterium]
MDTDQVAESTLRFSSEINWSEDDIKGKCVIELGSGAGRFVDVVSRMGARLIVGLDASDAVDATQANLGHRENVLIVQADMFHPPFRPGTFDLSYSIGVMHHTPSPSDAFKKMVELTKYGGRVGVSLYEISLYRRPNRNSLKTSTMELLWAMNAWRCEFFRTITTRLPQTWFLAYCK